VDERGRAELDERTRVLEAGLGALEYRYGLAEKRETVRASGMSATWRRRLC
jgi:hypothetical protein